MKKFNVFTLDRILIYGGLCTLITVLAAMAFRYSTTHHIHVPIHQWVITALAVVAFWTISIVLFGNRYAFKKSIHFITKHGVLVRGDFGNVEGLSSYDLQLKIESSYDAVIEHWSKWGAREKINNANDMIKNYLDGSILTFKPTPMGRMNNGYLQQLAGTAGEEWVEVLWPAGKEYPDRLLQHEVAHECLNAMNVATTEDANHVLMSKEGF